MENDSKPIINPETGEIETYLRKGDRIVRKESVNSFRKRNEKFLETRPDTVNQFFKGNTKEIMLVMNELEVHEKAFLFCVAPYVSYVDCCLKYGNGVDITSEDLLAITGLKRTKLFEVTNSLVKKDLIYKGINSKNRQYYVNPWLFCKGKELNKVLKNMFKNYRIRSLNGMKWGNMSD